MRSFRLQPSDQLLICEGRASRRLWYLSDREAWQTRYIAYWEKLQRLDFLYLAAF